MSQQPASSGDWAAQAADTIVRVVGTVRDKTTRPVVIATRAIVFGLLAAIGGIAALVLAAIGIVRLLVIATGHRAWAAHLITGALFTLVGFILMAKRTTRRPEHA
jgi:hypothetical protein